MEFEWKNFNINLDKVLEQIKSIDSNCCGMCADVNLRVCFTKEPSEETKTAINEYYNSINEESIEATSYVRSPSRGGL